MINLFDEEILRPKKKKTIKPSTILLVAIVVLMILCVAIIVLIFYLKGAILTITLDEDEAKELENVFF